MGVMGRRILLSTSRHLGREFERCGRRGDEFILSLLQHVAKHESKTTPPPKPAVQPGANFAIQVSIGDDPKTGQKLSYTFNAPGQSPHIAIMGRIRSGKTRTGLTILRSICDTTKNQVPCLIFDYAKGDIADNEEFAKAIKAIVVRLPSTQIPIAPLVLLSYDEQSIKLATRRFVDTIRSVVRLGPKQADTCLRLIKEAYNQARQYTGTAPDLSSLLAIGEEMYQDEDKPPDSLLASLRDFADFPLFRPAIEGEKHTLLETSHIIDLHHLPESLRKIAVFLTLDRIYTEIMEMPDAPLDIHKNRQMRLIVAIDEAHNYLPCKQPTLEKLVRESASKGVSVILMSQSPDDFDQPKYNFAKEMGLTIVFACAIERPRMLEAVLGGNIEPQRLSQLPAGIALTRLPSSPRPLEIRAWTP